jgi:hypothetical protein
MQICVYSLTIDILVNEENGGHVKSLDWSLAFHYQTDVLETKMGEGKGGVLRQKTHTTNNMDFFCWKRANAKTCLATILAESNHHKSWILISHFMML